MRSVIRIIRTATIMALLGFILAGCATGAWNAADREGRSWAEEVSRNPGPNFTDKWGHAGVHPWEP